MTYARKSLSPSLIAISILSATCFVYLPAIRGGFVWDDDDYVTNNVTLHSLDGLRRIWLEPGATPQYYPLVFTTFWIEHHLWGDHPLGYHITNIILHAASAFLLWRLLAGLHIQRALLAAMLFAVHPVHVESVAWITERKNVLSGLFYLAAAWTYLRSTGLIDPPNTLSRKTKSPHSAYFLSLALFLAALLSKTVTASLPVALLLIIYMKRQRIAAGDLLRVTPMLVLGALLGLFTVWMEHHHVGTKNVDFGLSLADRCQIAGRAICFYLGKLFWPHDLAFIYPRWNLQEWNWTAWLYPAGVIASVALLFANRRRLGTGPLVAIMFFIITLGPALGFIDVYPLRFSFVADHFQYLATIGPLTLLAAGVCRLPSPNVRVPRTGVVLVVLAAFLTWRQASNYQNAETLWRDTLAKNPNGWMPHYNLGVNLADQGRHEEAIEHFRNSFENNPAHADAHGNMGMSLIALSRSDEAFAALQRALEINPDYPEAHYNLAHLLAASGDVAGAMQHLQEALRIRPDYYDAHNNLAILLGAQGQVDEAIREFRAALEINPDYTEARFNLAQTLLRANRPADALPEYEEVLRQSPDDADAKAGVAECKRLLSGS